METTKKEWFAVKDGDKWINYGYVEETGLYHWEKNINYAGYTPEELIEMGAE